MAPHKAICLVWTATVQGSTHHSHTSNIMPVHAVWIRYPGCQRLFYRSFWFLSSLYSDPCLAARGFRLWLKMCQPSAHTKNSCRMQEKPLDKIKAWCTKFRSSLLNICPVCYSIHFHLFTSVMGRIGVQTAPNYGTMPIWYVTLHFHDCH